MEQESAGGGFSRRSRGIGNQYLRKPIARERLEGYLNQRILSATLRQTVDILNSSEGYRVLSIAPLTRRLHSKYRAARPLLGTDGPIILDAAKGPVQKKRIGSFRIGDIAITNAQFASFFEANRDVTEAE